MAPYQILPHRHALKLNQPSLANRHLNSCNLFFKLSLLSGALIINLYNLLPTENPSKRQNSLNLRMHQATRSLFNSNAWIGEDGVCLRNILAKLGIWWIPLIKPISKIYDWWQKSHHLHLVKPISNLKIY